MTGVSLSPDFEALRWFPLPSGCLGGREPAEPITYLANTPMGTMCDEFTTGREPTWT
jgi:hypothetical protein